MLAENGAIEKVKRRARLGRADGRARRSLKTLPSISRGSRRSDVATLSSQFMVKRTDNSIWALSPRTKENAEVCAVDRAIAVQIWRVLARIRRNDGAPSAE